MSLSPLQTVEIIESLENFVEKMRSKDEEMLKLLDYGHRIDEQSIILFEKRPDWKDPSIIREHAFAKTTFVKSSNHWKIFWLRATLKWDPYTIQTVKTLAEFLQIVKEDKNHCFFG